MGDSHTMRAYELSAEGKFRLVRVPVPKPGPRDVRVRVAFSGICGSDLHSLAGRHPFVHPPLVLGHEFSGVVEAAGADVEGLEPGARVTVLPSLWCGECRTCREGRPHICERLRVLGNTGPQGSNAEFVTVPGEIVFELPGSMTLEEGALVEPLAVGVHGVGRAGAGRGDRALVIGAGTIGLLTAWALAAEGVEVLVTDVHDARLELVRRLIPSARTANASVSDVAGEVEATWPGHGADVVMECVGRPETIRDAFRAARRGNRIVLLGLGDEEFTAWPGEFHAGELELVGSLMYVPQDYRKAIGLIASGRVRAAEIVDRVYPIGEIDEAFARARDSSRAKPKVLLRIEGWPEG